MDSTFIPQKRRGLSLFQYSGSHSVEIKSVYFSALFFLHLVLKARSISVSCQKASFPPPRYHSLGSRHPLSSLYTLTICYFNLSPSVFCGAEWVPLWVGPEGRTWVLGALLVAVQTQLDLDPLLSSRSAPSLSSNFFFPDSLISKQRGLLPFDSATTHPNSTGEADSSGWG